MPYKDKDGRVKHIKKIGEVITEQIPEGTHVHVQCGFWVGCTCIRIGPSTSTCNLNGG